ncbi:PfkB family carbohydrate kinase [Amnibacterium endophyticum]|uniref:PfkB family carbohydrate kinase n=1 Tax=Amnibacterium endophyticum TaxID=2109337 RepID=A0ABW4LCT8_9MICO
MSRRVVTVGNAMVDVVARVPHLPDRGGDVLARGGGIEVGGGGFRAVVAAAVEGVPAVYAGRIGSGPFGALVRAALDAHGIEVPLPAVPGMDTGHVLTMVEPDGERTFATVPGAESAAPALEGLRWASGDHLHVHGYGLVAPGRAAAVVDAVVALPQDAVVLLDPGPFGADAPAEALARLLPRLDWWSGNEAEARAATGLGQPADAARLLAGTARRGAVVRLGAAGCLLALRGAPVEHLPAPAVRAVDTNGAGDVHVGTFLARLALQDDARTAAIRANAAAAAHVARALPF